MALKPDRNEIQTDISYFMNTAVERGGLVALSTVGSGAAMDQNEALVTCSGTTASGVVLMGCLLNDMVNRDLTQTHINWHKDEVQLGGKVTILRKGIVNTNAIDSSTSVGVGSAAYANTGLFGGVAQALVFSADDPGDSQQVGRFLSTKDEDGYAKVEVNLP